MRRYPTISVGGVLLEYRHIPGDAAAPTLVLLHEGLGCVALWRDFPDKLAAATRRSVFVYSRAGYGGSDPIDLPRPLDYMSIEAVDVLPDVLACADISAHTLIGHSDGATIALVNAGRTPGPGLASVVVLAPHIFAEAAGVASIAAIEKTYATGDLRARLEKYHGANVDCAFRGWCDSWLDPRFLQWSVEREIETIEVPILQVQGSADEYGSVAQLRRIAELTKIPVKTVLFEGCGHAPQFERQAETLEAIGRFCARRGFP